jgi:2-oxoglutarate/2-oxoacid ferredoxin oxidoreductase subunit alpha
MADPFQYPDGPIDRGKVLDESELARVGEWGRYQDVDGDAIPWRTLPGTNMPAYFARGSGHNEKGQYSERGDDYQRNMERLARKFETARSLVPTPEVTTSAGARVGLIAYGTSHWAIVESRDQLRDEAALETSYLRLKAFPFTSDLAAFIDRHDRVYLVEQNRDAQMLALMRMELDPERAVKLRSVLHFNGLPIDARSVTDDILAQEGLAMARAASEPSVAPHAAGVGGE